MVTWKMLYTDIKKQIVILNKFIYANSARYYQYYEQITVCVTSFQRPSTEFYLWCTKKNYKSIRPIYQCLMFYEQILDRVFGSFKCSYYGW